MIPLFLFAFCCECGCVLCVLCVCLMLVACVFSLACVWYVVCGVVLCVVVSAWFACL